MVGRLVRFLDTLEPRHLVESQIRILGRSAAPIFHWQIDSVSNSHTRRRGFGCFTTRVVPTVSS